MKKFIVFFVLAIALFPNMRAFAAWELLKDEPSGVNYIDTSSYKCTCRNPDIAYFKIKQIPTHSNAKYIIYNFKANLDNGMLYTHATRYYNSGYAEDVEFPPIPGKTVSPSKALYIGIKKACDYCDRYCKSK